MGDATDITTQLPAVSAHGWSSERYRRQHEMQGPWSIPANPDAMSLALFQSCGVELKPGHHVELIQNGDVFDRIVDEIGRAQVSVNILMYIWRPSDPSDRVIVALIERARRGVKCRVVVDPIGSEHVTGGKDFDQRVEPLLKKHGIEVHYYRLLGGKVWGRILGRDHQKLVIVDGKRAITGGFGIWEVWEGHGESKDHWRDTSILVEGPAVRDIQVTFAQSWQEAGGRLLGPEEFPAIDVDGHVRAGFVSSHGQLGVTNAERMYRLAFAAARRRLWIANAYFSPPGGMLEQLEEKCRQGVDVRVLAPGPVHDQRVILASQRSTYERLLKAGVRIFEYRPSMMHSKTVVVDDWMGIVGSTNLDPLSLNKLGEGSLVFSDGPIIDAMARTFEADMAKSNVITLDDGGRTNPIRRIARRMTIWLGMDR